jgi:hypothetical protein
MTRDALRGPPIVNNYVNDDEADECMMMASLSWQHPSRRRRKTARCERCRTKIKIKSRGRVPKFCSPTCRQLAYERRKWQRPTPVELLAQDTATIKVRDFIRAEIWAVLQTANLVPPNQPPPLTPPKRQRPTHLRVVKPQPEHELPDSLSALPKAPQDD